MKKGIPDKIPVYLPTDKGGMLEQEIINVMESLAVKPEENAADLQILEQLLMKVQEVQLNSSTNAEMYAAQTLNAELTAAMPQIQQQVTDTTTQMLTGGLQ